VYVPDVLQMEDWRNIQVAPLQQQEW